MNKFYILKLIAVPFHSQLFASELLCRNYSPVALYKEILLHKRKCMKKSYKSDVTLFDSNLYHNSTAEATLSKSTLQIKDMNFL